MDTQTVIYNHCARIPEDRHFAYVLGYNINVQVQLSPPQKQLQSFRFKLGSRTSFCEVHIIFLSSAVAGFMDSDEVSTKTLVGERIVWEALRGEGACI
jgi:hypothetical protein